MKGNGELASSDIEKAEVLNECFDSIFTGGQASQVCQDHEPLGEGVGSTFCPTVTVEQVQVLLMKLNVYKSMGLNELNVLKVCVGGKRHEDSQIPVENSVLNEELPVIVTCKRCKHNSASHCQVKCEHRPWKRILKC